MKEGINTVAGTGSRYFQLIPQQGSWGSSLSSFTRQIWTSEKQMWETIPWVPGSMCIQSLWDSPSLGRDAGAGPRCTAQLYSGSHAGLPQESLNHIGLLWEGLWGMASRAGGCFSFDCTPLEGCPPPHLRLQRDPVGASSCWAAGVAALGAGSVFLACTALQLGLPDRVT